MAQLADIVSYLDQELRTGEIADYSHALNGLQLANSGNVTRLIAAVDASLSVIEAAAAEGGGLLLVHHGMFWQGLQPVTGPLYRKLKTAMDADLALYSSHLPLDVHPVWGNNARLSQLLGLQDIEPFFDRKGHPMGLTGTCDCDRTALGIRLEQVVGGPVHCCRGGSEATGKIGIITGGAGSEVAAVAACGVDTFITGEGPHWSYPLAQELGINVFYAGHYATETFGVNALAAALSDTFGLPWQFMHSPTGL